MIWSAVLPGRIRGVKPLYFAAYFYCREQDSKSCSYPIAYEICQSFKLKTRKHTAGFSRGRRCSKHPARCLAAQSGILD